MNEPQRPKSSPISTISSLVNSMIGGTILTLPLLFKQSGMGVSIIILFLSGAIAYKTCVLYVIHMSSTQINIQETISRISGPKWGRFFRGLSGYVMLTLGIIYMSLIQDRVYGIIYYFLELSNHSDWIAPKDAQTLVFNVFSRQYLTLILAVPLFIFASLKRLDIIIKVAAFGSISFMLYMIFIIFEFFSVVGSTEFSKIVWFSTDIGNLTGTCAFSFTIHPTVGPVIKNSKYQENNKKYLMISYLIAFLIYLGIGVLGSVAVLNLQCSVTILNCYKSSWRALLVEISYLLGLITVWPIFVQIFRVRLLQFHLGQVTPRNSRILNIFFITFSSIVIFFSPYLPIDLLMGLFGSLLCFFLIYLIPTKFHFDCLYKKKKDGVSETSQSLITNSVNSKSNEAETNSKSTSDSSAKCDHPDDYAEQYPKIGRIILYATLNIIGLVVGVYGVYQFYVQVFGDK